LYSQKKKKTLSAHHKKTTTMFNVKLIVAVCLLSFAILHLTKADENPQEKLPQGKSRRTRLQIDVDGTRENLRKIVSVASRRKEFEEAFRELGMWEKVKQMMRSKGFRKNEKTG